MEKPYGIISDTHNHAWSQFSEVMPDGVNSRLRIILDETYRAAETVAIAGGDTLFHGGDMFHVRGSIAPSVLNPTIECYKRIHQEFGIDVVAIPGNHDLEGRDASFNSNAANSLRDSGVRVVNTPTTIGGVVLVPWVQDIGKLKESLERWSSKVGDNVDIIIHAPVDGVIMGIPDHGLDPKWLGDLSFRNVFCGHYHNHKDFGNGVYSIGALTHQTWGDVSSVAGFIIVDGGDVIHHASCAPSFVDLDLTDKKTKLAAFKIEGNYIRVKTTSGDEKKLKQVRDMLTDKGAAGVVIHAIHDKSPTLRTTATVSAGASVQQSVCEYVKEKGYENQKALILECSDILNEVGVY